MTDPEKKQTTLRWKIIVVWMFIITTIEGIYHFSLEGKDSTLQGMAFLVYLCVAGISLLIWWLFISGASLKLKAQGILGVALVSLLFRCDGYNGDTMPIVKFRWSAKSTASQNPVEEAQLDLIKLQFQDYQLLETDWPDYRGNGRNGIVSGIKFQEFWLNPKLVWKISIGEGWSSFCSVRDICWTLEQLDQLEAVTAYDVKTGSKLWQRTFSERFDETFGGPGPRTTPVFEGGRIWTLGGTGLLNCFNAATGTPYWKVNILKDNDVENIEWGVAASPLLHKDLVIVLPGGSNGKSLVAYDKTTGEKKWSGGNSVASYSSPQISQIDDVEQILVHNGIGISAHSVENGEVLWDFPWTTGSKVNVAQPIIYNGNKVIISSGYTVGTICLEISNEGEKWRVEESWRSRKLKAKFNALVAKGKHLFGLDEGILTCLDMDSGKRLWKGGRYGYGQMILVGDVLVILSEKGEVVYVRATPDKHDEIGKFQAIKGKTWQHPTIANGRLLVRNAQEAACFLLTKDEQR